MTALLDPGEALELPLEGSDTRFTTDLDRSEALLSRHLISAVQRFGAAALDVVDLPSLASPATFSPDQVRATAGLYWVSEIEEAGLPEFVDALAEGVVGGRIFLPLTQGADALVQYWQGRAKRFTVNERRALYSRTFGRDPANPSSFDEELTAVCLGLAAIGRAPALEGVSSLIARVQLSARELAEELSSRGTGIVPWAAREIVGHIKAAMQVLRNQDVSLALGGGGPWQIVQSHARQVLGREVDPSRHLDLASSGLSILAWVADAAAAFEVGTGQLARDAPQIRAAELWLAARGSS